MSDITGLDRISHHLAVITNAGVVILLVLVSAQMLRGLVTREDTVARHVYEVDETIEISGVAFGTFDRAMVLVIRRDCSFCTDNMDFYRALMERRHEHPRLRVIAVSPNETSDTRAYLAAHHVTVDDIVHSPLNRLKVTGTPTVILIDGEGRVKRLWRGRLGPSRQKNALAAFAVVPNQSEQLERKW